MRRIKYFVEKHPELFEYLPATNINPHDRLMERWFLRFLPARYFTPNRITLLRILMTPVVFFLILFVQYKVGVALFLLTAFTDAIDGSMARTRNQITRFGMLFDPLADKLLIGSMVLLLVFRYFNFWLGFTILGIEIIFMVGATITKVKFRTIRMANLWGKMKMIFQVLAVFVTLLALLLDFPILLTVATWIFGLAIGFAILSLFTHGI